MFKQDVLDLAKPIVWRRDCNWGLQNKGSFIQSQCICLTSRLNGGKLEFHDITSSVNGGKHKKSDGNIILIVTKQIPEFTFSEELLKVLFINVAKEETHNIKIVAKVEILIQSATAFIEKIYSPRSEDLSSFPLYINQNEALFLVHPLYNGKSLQEKFCSVIRKALQAKCDERDINGKRAHTFSRGDELKGKVQQLFDDIKQKLVDSGAFFEGCTIQISVSDVSVQKKTKKSTYAIGDAAEDAITKVSSDSALESICKVRAYSATSDVPEKIGMGFVVEGGNVITCRHVVVNEDNDSFYDRYEFIFGSGDTHSFNSNSEGITICHSKKEAVETSFTESDIAIISGIPSLISKKALAFNCNTIANKSPIEFACASDADYIDDLTDGKYGKSRKYPKLFKLKDCSVMVGYSGGAVLKDGLVVGMILCGTSKIIGISSDNLPTNEHELINPHAIKAEAIVEFINTKITK